MLFHSGFARPVTQLGANSASEICGSKFKINGVCGGGGDLHPGKKE